MGTFGTIRKADHAEAWTAFWDEQGPDSRCLQGCSPEVQRVLADHWLTFARTLPPAAITLDIGCGGGAATRCLASARADLGVVGIDIARIRAVEHPQLRIMGNTAAEELPFPNESFDAAVSQFGFEYSDIFLAAQELARVLRPAAVFSFVVHHCGSTIVRREQMHASALRELSSGSVEQAFIARDVDELSRQLSFMRGRYPDDQTIGFAVRCLWAKCGGEQDERQRFWQVVMEAIAPDRTLSAALQDSCVAPAAIDDWLAPLRAEFEVAAPVPMRAAGEVLAWKIEGVRKSA